MNKKTVSTVPQLWSPWSLAAIFWQLCKQPKNIVSSGIIVCKCVYAATEYICNLDEYLDDIILYYYPFVLFFKIKSSFFLVFRPSLLKWFHVFSLYTKTAMKLLSELWVSLCEYDTYSLTCLKQLLGIWRRNMNRDMDAAVINTCLISVCI